MVHAQVKLSDIVTRSHLSKDYAYPILSGTRKNPSRDRIIALCIGAQMSLSETQRALEIAKAGILYPKDNRDAALIVCLNEKQYDIIKINAFLESHGLEPLVTARME